MVVESDMKLESLMAIISDANLRQALDILAALGFAPRAPVKMELFADEYEKG